MEGWRGRYAIALGGSLAFHAAIFASILPSEGLLVVTESPAAGTLRVTLGAPAHDRASDRMAGVRPAARRVAAGEPVAERMAASRPPLAPPPSPAAQPEFASTAGEPASQRAAEAMPPPSSPTGATEPLDHDRARLLGEVRSAFARYFRYPLLARRRGWEGRALVAFRITPSGQIEGAALLAGSGHPLLDRAALEALTRVPPLQHPPGRELQFEMPVIYRLDRG